MPLTVVADMGRKRALDSRQGFPFLFGSAHPGTEILLQENPNVVPADRVYPLGFVLKLLINVKVRFNTFPTIIYTLWLRVLRNFKRTISR